NAGTMLEANTTMEAQVPTVAGTMGLVQAVVPDARFGVGRFAQYAQAPWNDTGTSVGVVPFEHVLTPSIDLATVKAGLHYARAHNSEPRGPPRPCSPAPTPPPPTGALPATPAAWVAPRASWTSSPETGVAESGPCPAGTVGYACFRPDAIPVTVVLTDTP